jgi:hypothetical protein
VLIQISLNGYKLNFCYKELKVFNSKFQARGVPKINTSTTKHRVQNNKNKSTQNNKNKLCKIHAPTKNTKIEHT